MAHRRRMNPRKEGRGVEMDLRKTIILLAHDKWQLVFPVPM